MHSLPVNDAEPTPPAVLPQPPETLCDAARIVFLRTAETLDSMNLAFQADSDVIASYASAIVNYERAQAVLDTSNVVIVSSDRKSIVKNPASTVALDWINTANRLGQQLGLSPSPTDLGVLSDPDGRADASGNPRQPFGR